MTLDIDYQNVHLKIILHKEYVQLLYLCQFITVSVPEAIYIR